jgi:hypothetical protein
VLVSDQVCGLVDAEADFGEGLVSAGAEQDVLAGGVDVPEAALKRMVSKDGFGAGQVEDSVDGLHASPQGLVRGQQGQSPFLQARFVSSAGVVPDLGDGAEQQ